jgi:broad specificity phosphatase PhoE
MEDYPVDRILCSPTVRCQQTVEPLARDRLLPIEPVAALGVDAGLTEIFELNWPKGSTWLLHRTALREVHARHLSPLALNDTVHSG